MYQPGHVQFIPLGGLGEIGMNCFALEQAGELLLVDCGATFPDEDCGASLVVPDFTFLLRHQEQLVGIFITHGHEDHIGALPYLLSRLEHAPPVYAPRHAHALLSQRLSEKKLSTDCLRLVEVGHEYQVGSFLVEPIAVAHSIIDATALRIETVAGTVVHTADFDLDDEQPAGHLTDEARLIALGDRGVRLLLCDSTNIDSENRSGSEGDVGRALSRVVSEQTGRVVVGLFSSNVHRLLSLGRAAQASGRKLCLLGRSLNRQYRIAARLGRCTFPSDLLVAPDQLSALSRERVLVVTGGSQGEPESALKRLSRGKHRELSLEPGDAVILSSRVIPGHELAVFAMTNDFLRRGVQMITAASEPHIHTSGHASRTELSTMMTWTRPEAFVPVHGTLHHLKRHLALAEELGVSDVMAVENGDSVRFSAAGPLMRGDSVPHGQLLLTKTGEVLGPKVLHQRSELGRAGLVVVSFALDEQENAASCPLVVSLGVAVIDEREDLRSGLAQEVARTIEAQRGRRMVTLEQAIEKNVKRWLGAECGEKPRVVVQVCRLGLL